MMFHIKLKTDKLYVGLRHVSYALVSDQQEIKGHEATMLVKKDSARTYPSEVALLRSVAGICKRNETFSRYVIEHHDGSTEAFDAFLKRVRVGVPTPKVDAYTPFVCTSEVGKLLVIERDLDRAAKRAIERFRQMVPGSDPPIERQDIRVTTLDLTTASSMRIDD